MKQILKSLYQNSRNKYIKELILDSFNKNHHVRFSVAKNIDAPVSILEYLSKDKDWQVRYSVAENLSTPEYILEVLSKDENHHVREAAARNSKTPIPVLEFLSKDENKYICETAHNTFKKIRKQNMVSALDAYYLEQLKGYRKHDGSVKTYNELLKELNEYKEKDINKSIELNFSVVYCIISTLISFSLLIYLFMSS